MNSYTKNQIWKSNLRPKQETQARDPTLDQNLGLKLNSYI